MLGSIEMGFGVESSWRDLRQEGGQWKGEEKFSAPPSTCDCFFRGSCQLIDEC